jgi:cytochrome oxidase Cu insertion factor (SCO1/SenC/PrrC family)
MPGMQSGLNADNPLIAEAFRAALRQQLFIVAAIFLGLWLARLIAMNWWAERGGPSGGRAKTSAEREPAGRLLLRIGFGVIWIFDGILQAQSAMPLGLTTQVIQPTAASSPAWVRHLVNWGGTSWTYHPIEISAAAVWIQVGIGLWLLFGQRGPWSRAGGLASVGWGLVVWVFGESFGGIFAPGLTWLFGAPGAVLFYCVAGALIALPWSAWRSPRLGRLVLAGMGVFFVGMAVLQAWPGRGFWQGTRHGVPGTLTGMISSMSQTSQPHVIARLVSWFADFVAAHGFAVNLVVVIALAVIGAAFLSGRPRLVRYAVVAGVVLCLADWVLIEDFGFFGGLGTDPNSMIPMALVFVAGYLALTGARPAPQAAAQPEPAQPAAQPEPAQPEPARPAAAQPEPAQPEPDEAARPEQAEPSLPAARSTGRLGSVLRSALRPIATSSTGSIAVLGALGVTLLGVVPAAAASANPNADPIIAQAVDGAIDPVDYPAAGFTLTDQDGSRVSLASLRGKVVVLTFLDPVCTSDCPLLGHEFAAAARQLAPDSRQVQFAAVVLSPTYYSLAAVQAFDRQEGLGRLPDWLYMTGSLGQLRKVWHDYAVVAQDLPAGAMTLHNDLAYVIGRNGRVRQVINTDPGPGTAASQSSFAVELADAARQSLAQA